MSGKLNTLHYRISIGAPTQKVYDTMLAPDTYAAWTAPFSPNSRYEGSWEKESKMWFLGDNQEGQTMGMVARIRENIPHQQVRIEHLGLWQDGQEITSGPEVDGWAGALENYIFQPTPTGTLLLIDVDANADYQDYFNQTWPAALQKLKTLCEN